MSFISNITHNATMHYWSKKLKGKWIRLAFLWLKNIEIDVFYKHKQQEKHTNNSKTQTNIRDFYKLKTLNFKKRAEIDSKDKEHIAVICPFFITDSFSYQQLLNFLESLQKQTLPPAYVFLIDDASPLPYSLPSIQNMQVIRLEKNMGPAYARNRGIEALQKLKLESSFDTSIVAFSDSDVVLSKNWLEEIFLGFKQNSQAFGLSGITQSLGKTIFDAYHNINGTLNGRILQEYDSLLYAPTCNLALLFRCLDDVYFDEDFPHAAGEDIHLCFNLLQKGYRIMLHKDMRVFHDFGYMPYTFFSNLKKFKQLFAKYAKGEKILLQKIPNYYDFLDKSIEIQSIES